MKPKIIVSIEITPGDWRESCFSLDEELVRDVFSPIDLPSLDANAWHKSICTQEFEIKRVQMERGKMAKLISEALTADILRQMSAKDTVMGYAVPNAESSGALNKQQKT